MHDIHTTYPRHSLGNYYYSLHQYTKAIKLYEQSLEFFKELVENEKALHSLRRN
jgi:hypothetical protein